MSSASRTGTVGGTCYLLTSTNLSLPFANWTIVATNTFDDSGHFTFTNFMNPNLPRSYYLLAVPWKEGVREFVFCESLKNCPFLADFR